jgi:cell division protein FtsI (penicillin-binding protein 3)
MRGIGPERPAPEAAAPARRPPVERQLQLRFMLLALLLGLWGVFIALRLFQIQVLEHSAYEIRAARQSERTVNLAPRRGAILDRNGRQLAVSVDAESIHAEPQSIRDADGEAAVLARALGLSASERHELAAQLRRDRAFVWVRRKVDPGQALAVRALELDGVGFLTENRRYYPKRELAAHVIGYAGTDNTGMWGIEYALDDIIRGRAAKVVVRTDARRRPVGHTEKPSTDGHTVVLTLDEAIQYAAERELEQAVRETRSVGGVVVVLAPRTGEILALANRPTFNPNVFGTYDPSQWRNRAVADSYEPGSIFKVITAAAALQEHVVTPDEVIDCGGGSIEVAGQRINDLSPHDKLRFRDVIAKSSDVGVIRVAQRLGRENLERYVRAFGFGAPTGVGLPGESGGLLRPLSKWSPLSLASISFGQEIGITALQMAVAVGAVANGGYLMKPLIVRQIEDGAGNVVRSFKPIAVRRVVDPETADVLTELLTGVVRYGTGQRAAVPGYVVAGKTGTAQKIDNTGRYSQEDHVASFVGFVPAKRPELVILVSLDTPRGPNNLGGEVAAPVFARVAQAALRRLAVPPDDAGHLIRVAGSAYEGSLPAAYHPTADAGVPASQASSTDAPTTMPDLRGLSAREASAIAAHLGLVVALTGSGRVAAQRPTPGAAVEPGVTCTLALGRAAQIAAAPPRGEGT